MARYIVYFEERSEEPQCNGKHLFVAESPVVPTLDLLRKNYLIAPGHCINVTYPGCEGCGGSTITEFRVEPFSDERAKELSLDGIVLTLKVEPVACVNLGQTTPQVTLSDRV